MNNHLILCGGAIASASLAVSFLAACAPRVEAQKVGENDGKPWRSALYPANWRPGFSIDGEGVPMEKRRMLPDFSYAGYHRGEKPIPSTPPGAVFDVTKFGATPDDQSDDTAAIKGALDAAAKAGGGIVMVPRGEFRVSLPSPDAKSALEIGGSGVVLRGAVENGQLVSKILNTSTQMRSKQVIRVAPQAGGSWFNEPKDAEKIVKLRADVLLPTQVLPVESVAPFKIGDWVMVAASTTAEWVAELGMNTEKYGWTANNPKGPMFCRQITAVDGAARTVSIDIPTRYALKMRDNARVYPIPAMIQEAGIENLQMAMLENKTPGWGGLDFNKPGTGAYEIHASSLIVLQNAANCWIKRVETYNPGNTGTNESNPKGNFHILSYGIGAILSRGITVADCVVSNPQYRGEGGNGYSYVLQGNDCLFVNCISNNARHSFSHKQMISSGNVITGCTSNTPSLALDFHMHLSMSNLIDNMTLNGDFIDAGVRPWGGKPLHGLTTSQSVFWNTRGLAYPKKEKFIVNSRQSGWGYVVGTSGPARAVQVTPSNAVDVETGVADKNGVLQPDWVEGAPRTDGIDDGRDGANLSPASLYRDQLGRRLGR